MQSSNPLAQFMPNQKDNTIRPTRKEKKMEAEKKAEISGQLRLTYLRDSLLDLSLQLLITPEHYFEDGVIAGQNSTSPENGQTKKLTQEDFKTLVGSLNEARFEDVCEERLAMKKCGNIACANSVSDDIIARARGLKFKISKANGYERIANKMPIAFCDGTPQTSMHCYKKYQEVEQRIKNVNEGGPFGTPMRNLVELLRSIVDHPKLYAFDRTRITKALGEFDHEISKVSNPIRERQQQVEKRVVQLKDGNPSDKNYQKGPEPSKSAEDRSQAAEKPRPNFKMKIISNRNRLPAAPTSLEPVPEEQHDKNQVAEESRPKPKPEEGKPAESKLKQDIQDSGKAKAVKEQERSGGTSQTLSYLSAEAMQLLDDICDEEPEASQEDDDGVEKVEETKEEVIRGPSSLEKANMESFMNKSVIKKRVRFAESNHQDDEEAEAAEDVTEANQPILAASNEVEEDQELQDQQEEADAEGKTAAEAESEGTEYGTEDDGSDYDFFEQDDADTIRQNIEEHIENLSSFQKLLLLCTKIANAKFKEFVRNSKPASVQLESRQNEVKDFLMRQLKVKIFNLPDYKDLQAALETKSSEEGTGGSNDPYSAIISHALRRLFAYIMMETFTLKFTDEDWVSLGKIFLQLVGKLLEKQEGPHLKELNAFIAAQTLTSEEALCLACLQRIE